LTPYEIDFDGVNYSLVRVQSKKDQPGKVRVVQGYYQSLEGVVGFLTRKKLVSSNKVLSLEGFLKEYGRLRTELSAKLTKLGL